MHSKLLSIGEVATDTGLTPRTLRYYEELQLIPPPIRTEGGTRLYTEAHLERLQRIKFLKEIMGLSLSNTKKAIEADSMLETLRKEYKSQEDLTEKIKLLTQIETLINSQLNLVNERLTILQQLKDFLTQRLSLCNLKKEEFLKKLSAEK
jgi:DNA-binding transcriptional MerR regulator